MMKFDREPPMTVTDRVGEQLEAMSNDLAGWEGRTDTPSEVWVCVLAHAEEIVRMAAEEWRAHR